MPYSVSTGSAAGDTSAISEVVEVPASIVLEEQTFELDDIDEEEALCHLEALGFGEDDPCILACYGSTSRYVPSRNLKKDLPYDWVKVVANCNGDRRFDLVRHHLQDPKTQNLGFLSAIGGTSKRRDKITGVVCMSYEIDNGLDIEGQKVAWKKANLPTPTIVSSQETSPSTGVGSSEHQLE